MIIFATDNGQRVYFILPKNELINAKRDIFSTACSNYRQGYRTSTTVNQLYQRYGKKFPQFTKEYLDKAVHLSIIKYLETEE